MADLLYLGDELINTSALTDAQLLDLAYERGYKPACRCVRCGHWIVDQPGLRAHIGPKCRRRLDVLAVAR